VYVCRTLKNLKTLQSPVFLSTGEDGRVQEGCGGIPLDRPLLLVSNHQTFDLGALHTRQSFRFSFPPPFFHLPPLLLTVYILPAHSGNTACTAGRCNTEGHCSFAARYTVLSLLAYTNALLCKTTIQTESVSVSYVASSRLCCGTHLVMPVRLVWFLANVRQVSVGRSQLLVVLSCRAT